MNTARRRTKGGFRSLSGLFADQAPGERATAHPGRASAWNDLSTAQETMDRRAWAELAVLPGVAGDDFTRFCFYEIYSLRRAFRVKVLP